MYRNHKGWVQEILRAGMQDAEVRSLLRRMLRPGLGDADDRLVGCLIKPDTGYNTIYMGHV